MQRSTHFLPNVMNHEWQLAYPVVLDAQSQHEYLTLLSFGSRTTQRKGSNSGLLLF